MGTNLAYKVGYKQSGPNVTVRLWSHDPGFPWILTGHNTIDDFLLEDAKGIQELNDMRGVQVLSSVQRAVGQALIHYSYREVVENPLG